MVSKTVLTCHCKLLTYFFRSFGVDDNYFSGFDRESTEKIHKCDQTWIINITKQQKNLIDNEEIFSKTPQIPIEFLTNARTRTPAEIQSCCNTCSRLAATSSAICSCLMVPESVGGPVLVAACTACCLAFVEMIRQDCESCCYNNLGL